MDFTEDADCHEISLVAGTGDMMESGGWQNVVTIGDEIDRGRKIREAKPKKSIPHPGGSEIMKIDFVAPPCIPFRKSKRKSHSPQNNRKRSKMPRKTSKEKSRSAPCSVRIVELAAPSKRSCVENWKKNYHILPSFMIERLKNVVIDQSPTVQIKDAYGSFRKRKKPKSDRQKTNNSVKQSRDDKADLKQLKEECKSGIHYFCALFGHKLNQKLLKSKNVGQCNQLGYLYNTVAEEIQLLLQPVKVVKAEVEEYNKFQEEICKTVAIWIRLVLRDTCDKILEEQLQELEEEEGPVLDFLDALLDNALNKCAPIQRTTEDGKQISDPNLQDTSSINTQDFCVQEIVRVLENILEDDTNSLNNDSKDIDVFNDNTDQQNPVDVSNDDGKVPDDLEVVNENTDFFEDAESVQQLESDEDYENVSEIRLSSRDDVEYEKKSTQNPISDNVNHRDIGISSRTSILNIGNKKTQYLSWASETTLPKTISSAPNAELLKEVNERWPENLNPYNLVKSTSIIRSVISLGNIGETDEVSFSENVDSTSSLKGSFESLEIQQSTSKLYNKKHGKGADILRKTFKQGLPYNKTHDVGTLSAEFDKEDKSVNTIPKVSENLAIQTKDLSKDNLTKEQSKENITKGQSKENSTKGQSKENSSKGQSKENSTKGQSKENSTKGQSKENISNKISKRSISKDGNSDRKLKFSNHIALDRKTSVTDLNCYLDKKLSVTDLCHGYLSNNALPTLKNYGYLISSDLSESTEKETGGMLFGSGGALLSDNDRSGLFDNSGAQLKANLKVDMNSAPSWLKWFEEECKRGSLSQKEAREWCNDLRYAVKSLEEVNDWIQKTSQTILRIQHRKELKRCCPLKCQQRIKDMAELKNIYITSTYYEKTNKHLKTLLVNHRPKYLKNKRTAENWTCNCRNFLKNLMK